MDALKRANTCDCVEVAIVNVPSEEIVSSCLSSHTRVKTLLSAVAKLCLGADGRTKPDNGGRDEHMCVDGQDTRWRPPVTPVTGQPVGI